MYSGPWRMLDKQDMRNQQICHRKKSWVPMRSEKYRFLIKPILECRGRGINPYMYTKFNRLMLINVAARQNSVMIILWLKSYFPFKILKYYMLQIIIKKNFGLYIYELHGKKNSDFNSFNKNLLRTYSMWKQSPLLLHEAYGLVQRQSLKQ